jgi:hypothetical protein
MSQRHAYPARVSLRSGGADPAPPVALRSGEQPSPPPATDPLIALRARLDEAERRIEVLESRLTAQGP